MLDMMFESDLVKLVVSVLVGATIGLEREYRSKAAGLRTFTLICLGATIFTILPQQISSTSPDRIASNIVTGIGFLGAGVIFKSDDRVSGLTTAIIIWITAALGMAIGEGHMVFSLIGAILVIVVISSFVGIEKAINRMAQARNYRLVFAYSPDLVEHYQQLFKACKLRIYRTKQSLKNQCLTVEFSAKGNAKDHRKVIERILADKSVVEFEF